MQTFQTKNAVFKCEDVWIKSKTSLIGNFGEQFLQMATRWPYCFETFEYKYLYPPTRCAFSWLSFIYRAWCITHVNEVHDRKVSMDATDFVRTVTVSTRALLWFSYIKAFHTEELLTQLKFTEYHQWSTGGGSYWRLRSRIWDSFSKFLARFRRFSVHKNCAI